METNEKKPIIIHIENEGAWTETNDSRDAFVHVLKNNLNLDVFVYRHDMIFKDDIVRLKKFFNRKQIILIIVDQEGECEQQNEVIPFVHKNISENIPIAVLINPNYENCFKGDEKKLTYAFYKESEPLINLIKTLTEAWVLAHNWFDERTNKDQAALMFKLENSYRKNYPEEDNDDGDFYPKDFNHMVIVQALRTRLHVGPIVQEEFHDTIPDVKSPDFTKINSSVYEEELARIQGMSFAQQEDLWQKMRDTLEGGVSCGRNVKGFAIDPISLEYLITKREGQHYGAGSLLFFRIIEIDSLKERYFKGEEADDDKCRERMITGLIFKVREFQTPILHIAEGSRIFAPTRKESTKRVIEFLREQQMFIPTHSGGKPFQNY